MIEPSPHVKELIAASSAVRPGSMRAIEFEMLWHKPRALVAEISVELYKHDTNFKVMREKAVLLINQIDRLADVDSELRAQTPNGKRPRAYSCPDFDYEPDIERSLLSALSCLHSGESPTNINRLLQNSRDAHELIKDAWFAHQKTQGFSKVRS